MKVFLQALSLIFFLNVAQAASPSADDLIGQAEAKAAKENKIVFVHLGASWCSNCKELEAFLERKEIKAVFQKYFVPVKLVVDEDEAHKNLETPGVSAWTAKLGEPQGLPFLAFLDKQGKLIVNSKPVIKNVTGENIGFPATKEEIAWFETMIKTAVPQITANEMKIIIEAVRK
jgi:thioredoxin-related protein